MGDKCKHENFDAAVDVNRIGSEAWMVGLRIKCVDCGTRLMFPTVRKGVDVTYATVSIDGTELRIPVKPVEL